MNTIEKPIADHICDLYCAEDYFIKRLTEIRESSENAGINNLVEAHLNITEKSKSFLIQISKQLNISPGTKISESLESLVRECEYHFGDPPSEDTLKNQILPSLHRFSLYQISGYLTLCTYAEELGHQEIVDMMQQNFDETVQLAAELKEWMKKTNKTNVN